MTIKKQRKSRTIRFLEKINGGALTFGEMLASIRIADELTLQEFAKKIAISVSHLSDIEHGRKMLSAERAAQFAKKLGYSEAYFVGLALQDTLRQQGLSRFLVHVECAA